MTTTLTVLLHGNPGTGDDWNLVVDQLGSVDVETPTRPAGGVGQLADLLGPLDRLIAARKPDRLRVVGYSWGCYLALHHAWRAQRRPDELVLVNPYVVAQNPISAGANVVLNLPVVGGAILRAKTKTMAPEFVANTFAPAQPPAGVADAMAARLADPAVWKGAVAYKLLQQNQPLARVADLPARTVIVRGGADQVADWNVQRAPLDGVRDDYEERVIEGAGHGLPWTHAAELARIIAGRGDA